MGKNKHKHKHKQNSTSSSSNQNQPPTPPPTPQPNGIWAFIKNFGTGIGIVSGLGLFGFIGNRYIEHGKIDQELSQVCEIISKGDKIELTEDLDSSVWVLSRINEKLKFIRRNQEAIHAADFKLIAKRFDDVTAYSGLELLTSARNTYERVEHVHPNFDALKTTAIYNLEFDKKFGKRYPVSSDIVGGLPVGVLALYDKINSSQSQSLTQSSKVISGYFTGTVPTALKEASYPVIDLKSETASALPNELLNQIKNKPRYFVPSGSGLEGVEDELGIDSLIPHTQKTKISTEKEFNDLLND